MNGIANKSVVGRDAYMSPYCFVTELFTEGILCGSVLSGGAEHGGIYGDDDSLI